MSDREDRVVDAAQRWAGDSLPRWDDVLFDADGGRGRPSTLLAMAYVAGFRAAEQARRGAPRT